MTGWRGADGSESSDLPIGLTTPSGRRLPPLQRGEFVTGKSLLRFPSRGGAPRKGRGGHPAPGGKSGAGVELGR
jgi:hypothetical protein